MAILKEIAQTERHSFDPELVRVILPYDFKTAIISIEGDISPPRPEQTPGLRYLSYGSSITHGGNAIRPTSTYAMQTARSLGADLINLGFAGSAQMEQEMGTYIGGRTDWDIATLEMGINVFHWSEEYYYEIVKKFVDEVTKHNEDRWIFCIDLFTFAADFQSLPKVAAFRTIIKELVAAKNLPKLHYLSGRELLKNYEDLSVDLVHPSENGHMEINNNLSRAIKNYMGAS